MKWVGIAGGLVAAVGHAVIAAGQPETGQVISAVGTALVGAAATAAHHDAGRALDKVYGDVQKSNGAAARGPRVQQAQ